MPATRPVLVVGAGPTGLTAAIELARRDVDVRIIDREPGPVEESRALAVQPRTLEIWLDQGVAEHAIEAGIPMRAFRARLEGAKPVRVELSGMGGPFDEPLILPQDETEALLVDRLAELGVDVERSTTLQGIEPGDEGPRAGLETPTGPEQLTPSWLIGADGAHSTVREELDLPFEGVPYPDRFVVTDVDVDTELVSREIHAWTREGRILLLIPLRREGHYRVITTHRPEDTGTDPDEAPSRDELQAWIDGVVEEPLILGEPRWSSVFRVHCRGVPTYRVGRVLLAGDAAHIHSPAGGQGMNTGIQDAHNLAWKLALVHRGIADADLMDAYHEERHPVGERLLRTTDRLFQIVTTGFPGSRLLRRWIARPLLARDRVQRRLRSFVSQRGIRYRRSPAIHRGPERSTGSFRDEEAPSAGDQLPDGPVQHGAQQRRLLEVLAGTTGHVLLVLEGTEPRSSPSRRARFLETVEERWPQVIEETWSILHASPAPDEQILVDIEGAIHEALARGAPGYEIVRPDGHIGARSPGLDPRWLEAYVQRLTRG